MNMITNGTIDEQVQKAIQRKTALGEGLIERTVDEKEIMNDLLNKL